VRAYAVVGVTDIIPPPSLEEKDALFQDELNFCVPSALSETSSIRTFRNQIYIQSEWSCCIPTAQAVTLLCVGGMEVWVHTSLTSTLVEGGRLLS
jgi:hypothetical protein